MTDRLDLLKQDIARCRLCRDAPLGQPMAHEPRPVFHAAPAARLLVASQAPGTRVHASGKPFDDASGDRLRDWMGLDRATFYGSPRLAFLPMAFCFPGQDAKGGDLPPRRECAPRWREAALAALPRVETILLVGSYAQDWHLGRLGLVRKGETLNQRMERWREIFAESSPRLLPLPHPSWRNTAWLKRNPWFEADVIPVVRREVARLVLAPA